MFTKAQQLDIVSRARVVIQTSDGADEHQDLLDELIEFEAQLTPGASDGTLDEHERRETYPEDYEDTGSYQGGYRTYRDGSMREDFGSDR